MLEVLPLPVAIQRTHQMPVRGVYYGLPAAGAVAAADGSPEEFWP